MKKFIYCGIITLSLAACVNDSTPITNKISNPPPSEFVEKNKKIDTKEKTTQVKPEKKLEKKPEKETLIATYTTDYGSWDVNRTHNMTLATKEINNKIIKPSETFSFNDVVGERTEERGYKLSTIFVYDDKVQGYGGGICQVSSTLYNAAVEADMEIVERHAHKGEVIYVPENKDATVSYGQLDFKFKNTYNHPIKIVANMKDDVLTTSIYSIT